MYVVDEHDKVVEIPGVPKPDSQSPDPVVVAIEGTVVLSYWPEKSKVANALRRCVFIHFHHPDLHLLGPPNDEALAGHPLWSRGLRHYNVFKVQHSSLIRELERMNSIHPMHTTVLFEGLNHYIFTFHDSTFECVAKAFEMETDAIKPNDRIKRMLRIISGAAAG